MTCPMSLIQQSTDRFFKTIHQIDFWLAIEPSNGLLVHFLSEKYKTSKYFDLVLDRMDTSGKPAFLMACYGDILGNEEERLHFHKIKTFPKNKFRCLNFFRNSIWWPIIRGLVDRNWPNSINKFLLKLQLNNKYQWRSKMIVSTLVYSLIKKRVYVFDHILRSNCSISKSSILNRMFGVLLRLKDEKRFEIFKFLLVRFYRPPQEGEGPPLTVLKACTQHGIQLEDFLSVVNFPKDEAKRHSIVRHLIISSYVNGNAKIFLYLISIKPDLISMFKDSNFWEWLIEKPQEIINYLINKIPDMLVWVDKYLSGKTSHYIRSTSILTKDMQNLLKVKLFVDYFSKRNTLYRLFNIWQKNLEHQFENNMESKCYFYTFYNIIKTMDLYGLPIRKPADLFCYWFLRQVCTTFNDHHKFRLCRNLALRILPILIEYGYNYNGLLPPIIFGISSNGTIERLLRKNRGITTDSPIFVDGYHVLILLRMVCGYIDPELSYNRMRPLQQLSTIVIRNHMLPPFKKNVDTLPIPLTLKQGILLTDELNKANLYKRFDLKEFESVYLDDVTLCYQTSNAIFDAKHYTTCADKCMHQSDGTPYL
ncbi:unnamed protein product [Dimorphilus gyrociliatus]|uniref:Uncharacterized protein n=1 Tax=Dimorphilus gyrociliatus TaxID=2664684 RepID=A0A7I8VBZ7_9ANNE|nr:unnamed protein product [Dimorphilus gyrociliatus]